MRQLFTDLFPVVLFLVPILTMRLFSEDKRLKIEQQLLTAPVTRKGIVLGKYFAALGVFFSAILSTLLDAFIMSIYGLPDWPVIIGNFAGLFLLGMTLISICMFFSSLTESQVISAVCGFVVSLFLMLIDSLSTTVSGEFFQGLFKDISFNSRYTPFTMGIFDLSNIVFFLSVTALFIIFTVAVLDRRRWN
jgi:ABC-2 type transport system permease protein